MDYFGCICTWILIESLIFFNYSAVSALAKMHTIQILVFYSLQPSPITAKSVIADCPSAIDMLKKSFHHYSYIIFIIIILNINFWQFINIRNITLILFSKIRNIDVNYIFNLVMSLFIVATFLLFNKQKQFTLWKRNFISQKSNTTFGCRWR